MVCRPSFDRLPPWRTFSRTNGWGCFDGLASRGFLRQAPATADFQQDERVGRRSFDRLRTNGWGCFGGLVSTGSRHGGLSAGRTGGTPVLRQAQDERVGVLRGASFDGLASRGSRHGGLSAGRTGGTPVLRQAQDERVGVLRQASFDGLRRNGRACFGGRPSTDSGPTGGGASTGFLRRAQEERAGLLRRASFDRLRTNGSRSFGGRPSTGSGRTSQGPSAGFLRQAQDERVRVLRRAQDERAGVLRRASFSKAACEVDCAATGLMQPRFPRAANWPGRKIQGRTSGPHGPTGCKLDWKTIAIRARDIRGRDVLRVSSQPSKQPYDKCYQCNSTHSSPQVSVDSHLSTGSHDSGPCESNRIGGGPKVSPTGSPGVSVGQACVASESCSFPNVPLTDQSWNCSIESHFHLRACPWRSAIGREAVAPGSHQRR